MIPLSTTTREVNETSKIHSSKKSGLSAALSNIFEKASQGGFHSYKELHGLKKGLDLLNDIVEEDGNENWKVAYQAFSKEVEGFLTSRFNEPLDEIVKLRLTEALRSLTLIPPPSLDEKGVNFLFLKLMSEARGKVRYSACPYFPWIGRADYSEGRGILATLFSLFPLTEMGAKVEGNIASIQYHLVPKKDEDGIIDEEIDVVINDLDTIMEEYVAKVFIEPRYRK